MDIVGDQTRIRESILSELSSLTSSCSIARSEVSLYSIVSVGRRYQKLIAGNDLMTQRPGFPGLKEGCRWCLCVERWKEAVMASERLGPEIVPK
jgi:uncharacterized protein (DUF2237 family)